MATKHIVFVILLVASVGFGLAIAAQERTDLTPPPIPRPIAGEFVMIRTDANGFVTLEKPTVQKLGDRDFVVGTIVIPPGTMQVYDRKRLWIPVSSILEMLELSALAEATSILSLPNPNPRNQPASASAQTLLPPVAK